MKLAAGKVSVTAIIVVAFIVGLGAMVMTGGESPAKTAGRFMAALSDGDYKTLAELSYADGVSREEFERQWQYTTDVAAPYYQFTYDIKAETRPTKETAVVRMDFVKNAGASGTYDEEFQLPMVKTKDGWRVDVYSLNREFIPGLPRG